MGKFRSVPVIALCALFLFLASGVTLLSSSVYREVQASSERRSDQRMALSYLISQLRAGDQAGGITIGNYGDVDAIFIADGANYETILYCHGGYLMELYAEKGLAFSPEDAVRIAPARSLTISQNAGLIHIEVEGDDGIGSQGDYLIQSNLTRIEIPPEEEQEASQSEAQMGELLLGEPMFGEPPFGSPNEEGAS